MLTRHKVVSALGPLVQDDSIPVRRRLHAGGDLLCALSDEHCLLRSLLQVPGAHLVIVPHEVVSSVRCARREHLELQSEYGQARQYSEAQ